MTGTSSHLAPDFAEHVAHFADSRIRANGIENWRHQIIAGRGYLTHPIEGAPHTVVVSRPLQPFELRQLRVPRALVDVKRRDVRLVLFHELVDADDHLFLALDGLLKAIGAFRNLLLREPALDGPDHAAHTIDRLKVCPRFVFHVFVSLSTK